MKRNSLKRFLAFIVSAMLTLSVVACDKQPQPNVTMDNQSKTMEDTNITLCKNGESPYKILVSASASVSEEYSASFLQKYLELSTGTTIPVVKETQANDVVSTDYVLSVGRTALLENSGVEVTEKEVTRDGYKIVRKENTVYICGGGDVGTSFGVYEFLKYQIGFEPYSQEEIFYEKKQEVKVKDFNYTDVPDFPYRVMGFPEADTTFLLRVVNTAQTNPKYAGAGSKDWVPGNAHTIRKILPEDTYGETHKEWTYTSGGTKSQLCLTNEELIATAIENLKVMILDNPAAKIVNISQDDYKKWCQCVTCQNEQLTYKTSGYVVRFVNKIVTALEQWRAETCPERDLMYTTFAYYASFSPPVHNNNGVFSVIDESCIPHEKLYMRITPIESCFSHAFNDPECEKNMTAYQDILGWKSLTNNFNVWDYEANYYHYLPLFNNMEALKENLLLYKELGVQSLFKEFIAGGNLTQFQHFRFYLISKLMWDTELDVETLTDNFFKNYYKDVAPQLREVYDLFRMHLKRVDEKRDYTLHFTIYNDVVVNSSVWPRNIVDKAESLLDEALEVCDKMDDRVLAEKLRNRVVAERICVQYLKIFNYKDYGYDMGIYSSLYNTFKADTERLNITLYKQGESVASFLNIYKP